MGSRRPKPKRLAEKLLQIRLNLYGGISQSDLLKRMGLDHELEQERISKYERGVLEPPLHVLCAYAEIANIFVENIIRDDLNLPVKLPTKIKKDFELPL
jgi:transcriptional regulator with XRE-family HTH domain